MRRGQSWDHAKYGKMIVDSLIRPDQLNSVFTACAPPSEPRSFRLFSISCFGLPARLTKGRFSQMSSLHFAVLAGSRETD
jgi:hypothetical protein